MATKLRFATLLLAAVSSVSAQDKTAPAAQTKTELCNDSDVGSPIDSSDLSFNPFAAGTELRAASKPPCPYEVGTNERPFHYLPSGATPPRLLDHSDPVYTGQAFWAGFEPETILRVVVSTGGVPLRILTERGSPSTEINKQAIELVRTWSWQPATRTGQPIAVPTTVRVKFRLQGNSANPYVYAPPRPEMPLRPEDLAHYPLTVYPVQIGVGLTSIGGYEVMVDITFDPFFDPFSDRGPAYRLTCTGKNRGCSIPQSGGYPARWLADHRVLEIIGKTKDDEWRTVEYDCETEPENPLSTMWWPIKYPWSIF